MAAYRFQAGGALRQGTFYVEREVDQVLLTELLARNCCNILSPRQMGKTSLAQRTAAKLREQGMRVALVDLTALGSQGVSAEAWFCSLADAVGQELGVDAMILWEQHRHLTPTERLFRFLRAQVAGADERPLVLFIDEIDVTFLLPFADDFFAAIRAGYNAAARDPVSARLVFCLIGVSVPLDLTSDPRQTPFNIGREIVLYDLRRTDIERLAPGLCELGADPSQLLDEIFGWTNGHPALTQFLCEKLVAQGRRDLDPKSRVAELVKDTLLQPIPRDTRVLLHIENYFEKVGGKASRMLALYRQVLSGTPVRVEHTNAVHIALRRLGLLAEVTDAGVCYLRPRNRIFNSVFNLTWVRQREQTHQFTGSVRRWIDQGRRHRDLLLPNELPVFESWAKRRDELLPEERDFLLESKTHKERGILRQRRLLIGLAVVLAVSLVFTIFRVNLVGQANESVLALKRQIGLLRGDYEAMVAYPERRKNVVKEAANLGHSMLGIDDERLTATYRIVKYQYAAYAFMMAASAHALIGQTEQTVADAEKTIVASQRGLRVFERARVSPNKEEQQTYQWTVEDNGQNRMRYLLAMAQSLKGEALGDPTLKAKALLTLSLVDVDYRKESLPMHTRELRWICPDSGAPAVCQPE